tara:strand:- start:558 stop:833 length:276 start_codon:yes stop_codon:yes gene_type:complete
MPRSGNIKEPIKVTLYMPRKTVKMGKKFASHVGTSLSQMVTDLIEHAVGETIPITLSMTQEMYKKLEERAEKDRTNMESLIADLINEGVGN